jgi:hypothetical protein
MLDRGVDTVKEKSVEIARWKPLCLQDAA